MAADDDRPGLDDEPGSGGGGREEVVARFEAACWAGGDWPEIDDFLPADGPDRAGWLVELIHTDVELRHKLGRPVCVADYLDRYPELIGDGDAVHSLLSAEREARRRRGDLAPRPPGSPAGGPARLGRFELIEEVGRGGCGVVYRARDLELDRVVAVKTPRADFVLTAEEAERFLREARHAARLKHPGIVAVHEVGPIDGRCCIVSEFIEGTTLAERRAAGALPPRLAAELAATVAEALDHAHRLGVIHRDVKPSNILLDRDGRPHLTDFGLARRDGGEATLTADGQVLGTPAYMAPEQARGEARKVDGRSDVYSLGVVLYELLTGEVPFRGSPGRVFQQVLHDDPRPPRSLDHRVPRDLETICLKAMAKEPGHRYPTAAALADDLRRSLRGEPVRARPMRWPGRLCRRARRRPLVATLVGALVLAVVLGFAGVVWQWRRAVAARRDLEGTLYAHRIALADRELAANNLGRAGEILDACPPPLRGWEWHYLRWRRRGRGPAVLRGHTGRVFGVAFSPDGRRLASSGEDQTVRIWDAATAKVVRTLRGHANAVFRVAFSPDGRRLASASRDGTVRTWDAATGRPLRSLRGGHELSWRAVYSPDGRQLAVGIGDGMVKVWDAATGRAIRTLRGHADRVTGVVYRPDGRRLASSSDDGTVRIWDAATGRPLLVLREPLAFPVIQVAFSPDGRRLASADRTGVLKLWDAASGRDLLTLHGHADIVWSVVFSPDGRRLASAGSDRTIRIWDATTGRELLALRGYTDDIRCLAFSPDGRRLASASWDGTIQVLGGAESAAEAALPPESILRGHTRHVRDVAYSPDGRRLASASDDGTVKVWDVAGGRVLHTLRGHTSGVLAVAYRPDGAQIASAGWDRTVRLWDATTGRQTALLQGHTSNIFDLAYAPDGRTLASSSWDKTVRVWDTTTRRALLTLRGHPDYLYSLTFSPGGRHLAVAGGDKSIKVWDATTGCLVHTLRGHKAMVRSVAYSPDGRSLASASGDGTLAIWDTATGRKLRAMRGHEDRATCVVYSPNGRSLASAGWDQTIRIWDAPTGQEAQVLRGHGMVIFSLTYSPDGRRLALAGTDGTVRLREVSSIIRTAPRMAGAAPLEGSM